MSTLLEARAITKVFGGGIMSRRQVMALEDFSLIVDDEEPTITGVVGESGSGKTTMARLLLGLEPVTRGAVLFRGRDLGSLSRTERMEFRRQVQMIFQDPFEVYNSFYKVDHALEVPIAKFHLAGSREEARDRIERALKAVGLQSDETLGRYPHQLSGGQRQRIMVARALLLEPKLIVADEPVSMIDASLRATVLDDLRRLNEQFGISLIYITHDLTTAYQVSHNIVVLYQGSVAEAGDVEMVVGDPQHPYTRLLISSIPLPDPDQRWGGELLEVSRPEVAAGNRGCKFAPRCPHMMPVCLEKPPPLYLSGDHRVAACYLQDQWPTITREDMGSIFIRRPLSSSAAAPKSADQSTTSGLSPTQ